ncbi:hypothetical protein X975_13059, partial [Stegodyphus mimosarum]
MFFIVKSILLLFHLFKKIVHGIKENEVAPLYVICRHHRHLIFTESFHIIFPVICLTIVQRKDVS